MLVYELAHDIFLCEGIQFGAGVTLKSTRFLKWRPFCGLHFVLCCAWQACAGTRICSGRQTLCLLWFVVLRDSAGDESEETVRDLQLKPPVGLCSLRLTNPRSDQEGCSGWTPYEHERLLNCKSWMCLNKWDALQVGGFLVV